MGRRWSPSNIFHIKIPKTPGEYLSHKNQASTITNSAQSSTSLHNLKVYTLQQWCVQPFSLSYALLST